MCEDTQRVAEPSQLRTLQTQWALRAEREELASASACILGPGSELSRLRAAGWWTSEHPEPVIFLSHSSGVEAATLGFGEGT